MRAVRTFSGPNGSARWQFGLTTVYHFLFVPLTLGLGWFVAYMQTRYYQTRDESWRKMAKFWGKLFLINFAIGVVTGIVQEFQFGMNWSEYSRYVGDIFGSLLAIDYAGFNQRRGETIEQTVRFFFADNFERFRKGE